VNRDFDIGNCAGNCNSILEHLAADIFRTARAFEAVVYPGASHGINFNRNATGAYGIPMEFVTKNKFVGTDLKRVVLESEYSSVIDYMQQPVLLEDLMRKRLAA
jgi:hypothetical protein